MPKKMDPIHPGEILNEEFLIPLNLSQYRLATHLTLAAMIFAATMVVAVTLSHAARLYSCQLSFRGVWCKNEGESIKCLGF